MVTSALQPFLELRSAAAARALAQRGLAGCRELADALDESIRDTARPILRPGLALVALGGYGRREQYRFSEVEVLFLGVDESATVAPSVMEALWDVGLRARYSVRTLVEATQDAREDLETLAGYFDARFIAGDQGVYQRFVDLRRGLVRRSRPAIKDTIARRHAALIAAEPWQLQEADLAASRGGLEELHALRWLELADAIAEHRGERAPGGPFGPLAAEHETLAQIRAALHTLQDEPNDCWRPDAAAAVAELIQVDPVVVTRRLMVAMRRVDAAIDAATRPRASRLARWGSILLPPPTAERPPGTDLERLLATLRAIGPATLEPLPRADWLDRMLPEWESLRGLPHSASAHQHPVDVHAVRTVVEARRAIVEDAGAMGTALVAQEIDTDELLLAALIHELGQGYPATDRGVGSILAERFASRAGFTAEVAHRLATATSLHLLLPTTAARRDVTDPEVVAQVTDAVGDITTLHLIYLVAVADARATGSEAWSAWTAARMRTLYLRVLERLRAGGPDTASATELRREAVYTALGDRFPREAIDAHIDALPTRYLLAVRPEAIAEHLTLIAQASGATAIRHDRTGQMERLTIVTHEHRAILAAASGVLAVDDVNVLGGSAYTCADGTAIGVLHVADALGYGIDEPRWARIGEDVARALTGEFPIAERLHAARQARLHLPRSSSQPIVQIESAGPDGFSVIEVNAADRVGLLHAITSALSALALDIHLAKVDTFGNEVTDAFSVLHEDGRRIEGEDEIEHVRRRILEAVASLDR